jgi:5-methylcytosine-specific restriction endonuclease McrA
MRRIHRGNLPITTRLAMYQRSKLCHDPDTARASWKSFRKSTAVRPLVSELKLMASVRGRCFYCSDGRGADVDHFIPIDIDFRQTWRWPNLLWVCPECNRKKGATFPIANGRPLLIDPTAVDPWSQLILDVSTCVLAPRFHGVVADQTGVETLRVLDILNFEGVVAGRARTMRRLVAAAGKVAAGPDRPATGGEMWREIDEDDYGVAAWFALWEGQDMMPFSVIKETQPQMWRHLVRVVTGRNRP